MEMYGMSQGSGYGNCGGCGGYGSGGGGRCGGLECIASSSVSYEISGGEVFGYEAGSGGGNNDGSGGIVINYGASLNGSLNSILSGGYGAGLSRGYGSGGIGGGREEGMVNYNQVDLMGGYGKSKVVEELLKNKVNEEYKFVPDDFLRPDRRRQKFVGKAEEIKEYVEEAFGVVMERDFPEDILVKVCSGKEFKKLSANPMVRGVSINRKKEGFVSDVFVLEDELDRVMLVVGHEIGHVLTESLRDRRDEEAKAFAFSLAWMEAIRERNIGGLAKGIILDKPAKNGVHDAGLGFVLGLVRGGKKALEVFKELVRGKVSIGFEAG